MSEEDDDIDSENDNNNVDGYCHFNEKGDEQSFCINLFGYDLEFIQSPSSKDLGHGAVVWDAAIVFVKYMECNPSLFNTSSLKDRRVLELGSGCGTSGLAMMMKGAIVTLTDLQCVVEVLTIPNADKIYNRMKSYGDIGLTLHKPIVYPLDWTSSINDPLRDNTYDIILLTDCIFSVLLASDLIQTILRYCHTRTEIMCCHEIRDEDASKEFINLLKVHCHIKHISKSKLHPSYKSDQIEIFIAKLRRK